jgi:hypothetical protein
LSITFAVEQKADAYQFQLVCSCGMTTLSRVFDSYQESVTAHPLFPSTCEDEFCRAYPARIEAIDGEDMSLNMSNVNAAHVMDALGIMEDDTRICGSMEAEVFLGRVLLAEAIAPADAGMLPFTDGSVTYGGREEGYLEEKLTVLRQIGSYALSEGLTVVWS